MTFSDEVVDCGTSRVRSLEKPTIFTISLELSDLINQSDTAIRLREEVKKTNAEVRHDFERISELKSDLVFTPADRRID
jgi:hypothetical protein